MAKRTKWVGVFLVVLALAIGAPYVSASVGHHRLQALSATTMSISPEALTQTAPSPLPVTEVESYF